MRFHVIRPQKRNSAQSPIRVVEQKTGREVVWLNRYLDREYVRRLADTTLRAYAYSLLHFVRWWESVHHTAEVVQRDLTESTLLDYLKFQSNQRPQIASTTINVRICIADRALRNEFPEAPFPMSQGFQHPYLKRGSLGLDGGDLASVDCESGNPNDKWSRSRSTRWHASGPASIQLGTWPSWG